MKPEQALRDRHYARKQSIVTSLKAKHHWFLIDAGGDMFVELHRLKKDGRIMAHETERDQLSSHKVSMSKTSLDASFTWKIRPVDACILMAPTFRAVGQRRLEPRVLASPLMEWNLISLNSDGTSFISFAPKQRKTRTSR